MPSSRSSDPHRKPTASRSRRPATVLAVAGASLGLLAAGCGSGSPPTSTTAAQSPQSIGAAAYKFAGCMRNHGIANFPDPVVINTPGQHTVKQAIPSSAARSPQFQVAQKDCQGILPAPSNLSPAREAAQQHARAQDLLAFARCLRSHGVQNFPDPDRQGELTLQMVNAAGVDLHAPRVLTAADSCVAVTHGAVTPAEVAQAVNGGQ